MLQIIAGRLIISTSESNIQV